jgi:PAS domain S-box-containing protein
MLLSLFPLAVILLLALPEIFLQLRVISASELDHRSDQTSGDAYDIEDYRLQAAGELRRESLRYTKTDGDYAQAVNSMRAAMLRLQAEAGPNPVEIETARRIISEATAILAMFDGVHAELRRGHVNRALALLGSLPYLEQIQKLQADERVFNAEADATGASEFQAVQGLWHASMLLLVFSILGLVLTSVLLFYYSGQAVRGIVELGRKGERYRRGEPLGAPSPRHDEIGRLDAALHEFVAAIELRDQQLRRYRLLAEVTSDIILFIDRIDLTVVDANAAALTAYGYERADLIGKPTAMLHLADDPIDAEAIALSDTPAGLSYEGMHQRSDGTAFPVEVHARTAEVDGRLTIVKTIRDISERRQAAEQISAALDQAVEASRLKGEFVATMSHEIRTPMHGVIGMSELLLERPLGPVEREYAATLKESAQALLAIIDDILDFSKLEANKIELEAVAFDPAQVVAGVVNLVRGAARDKGLALHSYASPHVPAVVRGDPTRVRQILINLVGNAVKFTANGAVTVSMSVERDDGGSIVLAFAVSDTGIGVSPEARERLFEAFTQGDSSTTRKFGGTGLGLSISRRLAELMGGRIWLGEHEGPGSTFCFTARFERTTEEVAAVIPADGLRVLVLNNDEAVRRTLEATLVSWGMKGASTGDIDDARAQLRDATLSGAPFEVVLIAYILPRGNGVAFAAELGEQPEYGQPARILVTAFDAVGRKEAALAAGCAAYLLKPVDPSDLYDALNAIERKRKTQGAGAVDVPRRARILLAEDSALIRRVARFQLQDLQYGVDIVENGEQAVAAVAAGDYELVLMDMRMPEMDGLAATRAIRAAERESGRHVVVIALTANVLEGDREACIEAGMDDFLTKPLQLDALRAVLERWLPEGV